MKFAGFEKNSDFCVLGIENQRIYSGKKLSARRAKKIAELAGRHVSIGKMVKLIEEKVENIICLQPFGCLPNHITGKGVLHNLRESYKNANIVAIDCDAGSSEVNQMNRIKLMLAVAKKFLKENRVAV